MARRTTDELLRDAELDRERYRMRAAAQRDPDVAYLFSTVRKLHGIATRTSSQRLHEIASAVEQEAKARTDAALRAVPPENLNAVPPANLET
jgi:hypothetical protein